MSLFAHVEAKNFDELREHLFDGNLKSADFWIFLSTSTVIATLGLFQNSPAVIIGAMIIAPLMKPLMGLSLASLTADADLLKRSLIALVLGTVLSIFISFILGLSLSFIEMTPEIMGRTHPNLLDLGVAFFAGSAGAYCQTHKRLYDTLAGVAIAVALVPPLSVVGIGFAMGQFVIWWGALLLYCTNLVGITLAGAIVFLAMGYTPLKNAGKPLLISICILSALIVPLGFSMYELVLENILATKIRRLLKETHTFKGVALHKVEVRRFQKPMNVLATVYNSGINVNRKQVRMVQEFLSKELGIPIDLTLRAIPLVEIYSSERSQETVPVAAPEYAEKIHTVEHESTNESAGEYEPTNNQ